MSSSQTSAKTAIGNQFIARTLFPTSSGATVVAAFMRGGSESAGYKPGGQGGSVRVSVAILQVDSSFTLVAPLTLKVDIESFFQLGTSPRQNRALPLQNRGMDLGSDRAAGGGWHPRASIVSELAAAAARWAGERIRERRRLQTCQLKCAAFASDQSGERGGVSYFGPSGGESRVAFRGRLAAPRHGTPRRRPGRSHRSGA